MNRPTPLNRIDLLIKCAANSRAPYFADRADAAHERRAWPDGPDLSGSCFSHAPLNGIVAFKIAWRHERNRPVEHALLGTGWRSASFHRAQLPKCETRPPLRVRGGVAEYVEEDGLGEDVELGEGGAALGAQCVRLVQNLRNPLLLGERWQWNPERAQRRRVHTWLCGSSRALCDLGPVVRRLEKVANEARLCCAAKANSNQIRCEHRIRRTFSNQKALTGCRAGSREDNVTCLESRPCGRPRIAFAPRHSRPIDYAALNVCYAKKFGPDGQLASRSGDTVVHRLRDVTEPRGLPAAHSSIPSSSFISRWISSSSFASSARISFGARCSTATCTTSL